LYEAYGIESFSMLDGMFAFSIHDKKTNKVLIARDFLRKPLYYCKNSDSFIWASELKSIIKFYHQNLLLIKQLLIYFKINLYPHPYSIYKDIHKLEANHYLEFDCNDFNFQIHEINQEFKTYPKISKPEATRITHDMVRESVVSRSIADVSLGTFLWC
jgi:asparagine synthase (glutamine-hydrolysing)